MGDKKLRTSYTPKGDWNWTETQVTIEQLPKVVQEGFKDSKYKEWQVKDIVAIEKPRTVANEYKIIVQKSMVTKKILVFDAKGRLYEEFTGL